MRCVRGVKVVRLCVLHHLIAPKYSRKQSVLKETVCVSQLIGKSEMPQISRQHYNWVRIVIRSRLTTMKSRRRSKRCSQV